MATVIEQGKCWVQDDPALRLKRYLSLSRLMYRDAQWIRDYFPAFFPLLKSDQNNELFFDLSSMNPVVATVEASDLQTTKVSGELLDQFEHALGVYHKALSKRELNFNEEVSSRECTVLNPRVHPELFPVIREAIGQRLVVLWGLESTLENGNVTLEQLASILREEFCDSEKKGAFWKSKLSKLLPELGQNASHIPTQPDASIPQQTVEPIPQKASLPIAESQTKPGNKTIPITQAPKPINLPTPANTDGKPIAKPVSVPSVPPEKKTETPSPRTNTVSQAQPQTQPTPSTLSTPKAAATPAVEQKVNGHHKTETTVVSRAPERKSPTIIGGMSSRLEVNAQSSRTGKKQVLLVDDEEAFLNLMTELLIQADYDVHPVGNPVDAIKILRTQTFDLIFTDQNMPYLKGLDFIDKCKSINPNIPIIMISGFIDSEAANKLREMRIEVFQKPINVIMLLKKAKDMIKQAEAFPMHTVIPTQLLLQQEVSIVKEKKSSPIRSFALKSVASRRFKQELDSIGKEVPNLVMVGPEGTHFVEICADISRQMNPGQFVFINLLKDQVSEETIIPLADELPDDATLVFVIPEGHLLEDTEREILTKLYHKTEPFQEITNEIKYVFCLNEDLDNLFAKGLIDVGLYLIIGQKEIFVPSINECKEDIPIISLHIIEDILGVTASQASMMIEQNALDSLCNVYWDRNYTQLKETLVEAFRLSGNKPISWDLIKTSMDNVRAQEISAEN